MKEENIGTVINDLNHCKIYAVEHISPPNPMRAIHKVEHIQGTIEATTIQQLSAITTPEKSSQPKPEAKTSQPKKAQHAISPTKTTNEEKNSVTLTTNLQTENSQERL